MSVRSADISPELEGQALRDAAKLVRTARMVEDAIARFRPDDSGRVSLVVRAFRPIHLETTRRVELTEAARRTTRQPRGAILDEVFAEANWPEYGSVAVIVVRGVAVAIEHTESQRI